MDQLTVFVSATRASPTILKPTAPKQGLRSEEFLNGLEVSGTPPRKWERSPFASTACWFSVWNFPSRGSLQQSVAVGVCKDQSII